MSNVVAFERRIPAMSSNAIAAVRVLEESVRELPQEPIETHHVLHGGMYARSITIPAGVVLTGAEILVPTTLVVNGDVTVYVGDDSIRMQGYCVLAASVGRKQAFIAHEDTMLTMIFATKATSIEQAEEEFTHEAHLLMSRHEGAVNHIHITGE